VQPKDHTVFLQPDLLQTKLILHLSSTEDNDKALGDFSEL